MSRLMCPIKLRRSSGGWLTRLFIPARLRCAAALPCLLSVCLFVLSAHVSIRPHPCSGYPLVLLTCHPCSMTACRRWPGMVWNMEYPWAKLDCKTLPASSTLGMMPTAPPPHQHLSIPFRLANVNPTFHSATAGSARISPFC